MIHKGKLLFCLAGLLVGFSVMAGSAVQAESITYTLEAPGYEIETTANGEHVINMQGFNYMLTPGEPMLPAYTYMFALPPGAEITSVRFEPTGTIELEGQFRIKPAEAIMPYNGDEQLMAKCREEWRENYEAAYNTDARYPAEAGLFAGAGGLRKYSVARISFFPFSFYPQSGKLEFTPAVNVTIEYNRGAIDSPRMQKLLGDTKADKTAAELFVNFDEAQGWYQPSTGITSSQISYDYLVIYGDGLYVPAVALVNGMQLGANAAIESASYIKANYFGVDNAEKIRNYLIDKYTEWGIQYLILVGDLSQIPMRMCFPDPNNHIPDDFTPPTDYYYADLTGDWDSDGDGYFGEYGEDNVDFIPELHVGRIPYNDSSTVHTIVNKLIGFQFDQGTWKNSALLLGAILNYYNEDDDGLARTDGAELMLDLFMDVFLPSILPTTEYEKAGLEPCPYTCNLVLNNSNAVGEWAAGNYGMVSWAAHGSSHGAFRKVWFTDYDSDGIPEGPEMFWDEFVKTGDESSLDDSHSSIVFASSCNNGWPEHSNLAKNLLRNGSAGMVASTRVSWGTVGWSSPSNGGINSLNYYFFDYLVNGPQDVGTALTSSRIYYDNHFLWWGWKGWQNLYNFCLYGDPQIVREGKLAGCCLIRGDYDENGSPDILDIDAFIDWLYRDGSPPNCEAAADVDANDQLDILDIDYYINWLWRDGPAPVPCS